MPARELTRELLIAAGPGEWRAAWLEDGGAAELYVERGDIKPAGSIHLGRVVRLVGGLDAALVDIGDARPGFLPLRPGSEEARQLHEGARVVVQIRREAQGGKAPRLSTRNPVARAPADVEALSAGSHGKEAPAQLYPPPGFAAALALRVPAMPEAVATDDPASLAELRAAFPQAQIGQAADERIDALFEAALSATLPLPGGGSIHIEESRAATLIDVDTGSPEGGSAERNALAANLAAAEAVARQLRLRQIGGGAIVDFAALDGRGARERVAQAVTAALAGDPAAPRVLGWTRLGHLEIVRPRRGRPLSEAMLAARGLGKSATALAFEALRLVFRAARASPAANWRLAVSGEVEAALRGPAAAGLAVLEQRLGRSIALERSHLGTAPPFDIVPR